MRTGTTPAPPAAVRQILFPSGHLKESPAVFGVDLAIPRHRVTGRYPGNEKFALSA